MQRSSWFAERLGLYVSRDRLSEAFCADLRAASTHRAMQASTVYVEGRSEAEVVAERRSSRRVPLTESEADVIGRFLADELTNLGEHFKCSLHEFEAPQCLRYRKGDFFIRHCDARRATDGTLPAGRKISIVIGLSPATDFDGGEFMVFPELGDIKGAGFEVALEPGQVLGFESDLSHEVRPVLSGDRFSLVTWAR